MKKQIRVLIAKPGLDGHDRNAIVISQALRDHGMEVIYTGPTQTAIQIAEVAIEENVDVIGLSLLSNAYLTLFPKVIKALKERQASDIPVIGYDIISSEDITYLIGQGIKRAFTSDSSTTSLVSYIQELVDPVKIEAPKSIVHIGIAVRSIDQALPFYTDALGLILEHVEILEPEGVKVAFIQIGESRIELLEALDDSSLIKQFIDKKGEGIHHIALEVDNINERLKQLKKLGIKLINEQAKLGANESQIAFIHPKSANGVLFELCSHTQRGVE